jgi:hypothetical protein
MEPVGVAQEGWTRVGAEMEGGEGTGSMVTGLPAYAVEQVVFETSRTTMS